MRALIVTNMWPGDAHPARGSFVADQVAALRSLAADAGPEPERALELEVFAFAAGGDPRAYARAAATLRRRSRDARFDVVHAHFGLTAWPAFAVRARVRAVTLHGTDVVHPRSRALTLAALPFVQLPAAVSEPLARRVPGWATHGRTLEILPTGVNLDRFRPQPRAGARRALGLDPGERILLFPADPARSEKRADRARALADAAGGRLITLGDVPPDAVATHVAAADAVLVTSERESFGLAALEALACEVPVLSTPVGVAPEALAGLSGALCAPFELERWRAALDAAPPRLTCGRTRAQDYSSETMARRVLAAWRTALAETEAGTG